MLRKLLLAFAVAALVISVATTVGADAKAGKAVYDKKCASCHGPNGEGKPAIAKMFKVEMRDLGSKDVQAKTDAELKKESAEGTGKMKPVAGLSDEDKANLVAFIRSLKK